MATYKHALKTKVTSDPAHPGKYQVDLKAPIAQSIDAILPVVEQEGYLFICMDECGKTYVSQEDPDVWIDIDKNDACHSHTLLTLHKDNVYEYDVSLAEKYLRTAYSEITLSIELSRRNKE